eukprot:2813038-Pyramimonas_sp.AAC.1
MAGADCKIMSLAFSWRLEQVARETASKARARLKGRSMRIKFSTPKSGGCSSLCWEGIFPACSSRTLRRRFRASLSPGFSGP